MPQYGGGLTHAQLAPLRPFVDLLLTLKTPSDAASWKEALARVDSVLILGGDLTSLAVTRALLTLGKKVFFLPIVITTVL